MRGLIFAQAINMEARHDASGAFIPGARQFARAHGLSEPIWLKDKNDRKLMIETIATARDLDVIAYFGHGTRSSLPSADIRWEHLPQLSEAVRGAAGANCRVILYACTTGIEGCFANQLAKILNYDVTVWGHTCAGHSFTNPYVTRFPYQPDGSPYLVEPHGPLWQDWYKLIKGKSDIWTRFPFLSKAAVETEIRTGTAQNVVDPRKMLIDI